MKACSVGNPVLKALGLSAVASLFVDIYQGGYSSMC